MGTLQPPFTSVQAADRLAWKESDSALRNHLRQLGFVPFRERIPYTLTFATIWRAPAANPGLTLQVADDPVPLRHFVAPTPADLALAASVVDSHPVVSAYAAVEWDSLHEDSQIWIAAIVREAVAQATSSAERGYINAFYDVAGLLGIGARADSPATVWQREMLPRLRAELKGDWQPIETAPRDGSTFLVFSPDSGMDFASYDADLGEFCKWGCGYQYATHWHRAPAAPTISDSAKTGGQG